jgi:uncharacterized membrane protein YeaQ/YmgE (transglycosylase-associated protein family)
VQKGTTLAIIIWIVIGLAAGWLASLILAGRGRGMSENLMLGAAGGFGGGFLFTHLSTAARPNFFVSLLTAIIGAAVVLLVWRVIRRA